MTEAKMSALAGRRGFAFVGIYPGGNPFRRHYDRSAYFNKRRTRHDELDAAITEWTSKYDHNEATRILQEQGIAAGPVLANWELVSNPHL